MDQFTVTRHLRPEFEPYVDDNGIFRYGVDNMGGITLQFDVDFTAPGVANVRYSYAQCHLDDNFSKEVGASIVKAKMDSGDYVVLNSYDTELSLVHNAYNDLIIKASKKDPIFIEKKLYRLRVMMKKIADRNQYCRDVFDTIIEYIDA